MPKKRAKLKEKEDDVSSCSQSKISKYFCAKSSQKLQTALSNVEVSREEKDEIPPEGQIQDLESVNLSEEYLRILPETLKKLENFAYRNNTPTDEDDVCLSDDFCHEMGTSIANAVVVTKADDFPPDSHGENLYADKSYEDQQRVDITDPNNTNPIGKSGKQKYTPLELQYLDFKKEYRDAILFIECGYKYRIFGEDAQVASKELGFGCFTNHNFPTSSFPVQRLAVHVRRLVSKGYKVGVVNQTETAATKAAGDTKNTLFSRKLHALYTQSTLIGEGFDDDTAVDDLIAYQAPMVSGYLMTVCDEELNGQRKHAASIGVMVVNVSTGNVMYASFEDDAPRSKLEDIFAQVNPVELLLPETKLTSKTENLITNVCDASSLTRGNIRVERKDDDIFDFSIALPAVSKFFSVKKNDTTEIDGIRESDRLKEVLSLPPLVLCCLSALISYLKEFDLGSILQEWRQFQPLCNSSQFMFLNAITIRNLEICSNSVDFSEKGSLFWTINYTSTRFGAKMLKSWLLKPLKTVEKINQRLDSVTAILHSDSPVWDILRKMLMKLPDLERLLCAAFYHRCSCIEFLSLSKTLMEIKSTVISVSEEVKADLGDHIFRETILSIPSLLDGIESFVKNVDEKAAREGNKNEIFLDVSRFPKIVDCKKRICLVEKSLDDLRASIAKTLGVFTFKYVEVMGQKYLIEVKNNMLSHVPKHWLKISSTKQVSRYRSSDVSEYCMKLQQCKEELAVHSSEAWNFFLDDFNTFFYKYKRAVSHLAEMDCIFSLCKLAQQERYCRPVVIEGEGSKLEIIRGRNPIICKLIGETTQYVENDTCLDHNKRCMIITGPNMGGKSSYVRQVALISILAQIGSFVPAASAALPLFDGIYVRMGAEDNIFLKRSTFMTEMIETSNIISSASSKSLVILDELGRGTSTHDGSAIAHAVLHHMITKVNCVTLFVTHYPRIASELQDTFPENVCTCHTAFYVRNKEEGANDSTGDVTFLYSITSGVASKSYGINVARLAGIPKKVLDQASQMSFNVEMKSDGSKCAHSIEQDLILLEHMDDDDG